MSSPTARGRARPTRPASEISARQASDHQQGTADHSVVHVVDRRLSSVVDCTDPAVQRLVRRAATHAGAERLDENRLVVFGTRIEQVVDALTEAGFRVVRTTPTTPSATSARTS